MTPQAATLAARNGPTIAINNTFRLAPQASLLYAADEMWWHQNPDALNFAGLKVSVGRVKSVHHILNLGVCGYSDRTDGLHTYGCSGGQAIQLAAKAGAARILLVGFDMHGGHWHPEHKTPLRQTGPEDFARWIRRFDVLAKALKVRGVEVVNCTPKSALSCFRFGDLAEELEKETCFR